jgi:hypothetical protein
MAIYVGDSYDMAGVWLYPGLMMNYKTGKFFIGARVVLSIFFEEGEYSRPGNVAPKVNLGYRVGHITLTAYILAWAGNGDSFLDVNFIGATVGYRF